MALHICRIHGRLKASLTRQAYYVSFVLVSYRVGALKIGSMGYAS